jgi:predicted Zn finger-like uncharacterized protein
MNELLACPKCKASLEVPVEMLGRKVRCGVCSQAFTARESGLADDEERERIPRSPGNRKAVFLVLGLFAALALLCCGGIGYLVYLGMHPKWINYESATGEFTAKFPGEPKPGTRQTGRGGESATLISAERTMFQEKYFVYFISLTAADLRKEPRQVLEELAAGLMKQNPGARDCKPRIDHTVENHQALDLCLEIDDERFLAVRLMVANEKAYVVGAEGPNDPDNCDWFDEFLDAFKPRKTPEKPAAPGKNPFRGKN